MMLLNAREFPTIGKESPQVCEMILWGPAPPFYPGPVISMSYRIGASFFSAKLLSF